MGLASCYSIYKNLPDAKICILCERGGDNVYFGWADKFGAKLIQYGNSEKSTMELACEQFEVGSVIITPDVMAVRPYMENSIGPSDAVADEFTTFVSYAKGCGSFVCGDEWATECPFLKATKQFSKDGINSTEIKILKMWEQVGIIYTMIGV
jgi:hypothetical protein